MSENLRDMIAKSLDGLKNETKAEKHVKDKNRDSELQRRHLTLRAIDSLLKNVLVSKSIQQHLSEEVDGVVFQTRYIPICVLKPSIYLMLNHDLVDWHRTQSIYDINHFALVQTDEIITTEKTIEMLKVARYAPVGYFMCLFYDKDENVVSFETQDDCKLYLRQKMIARFDK